MPDFAPQSWEMPFDWVEDAPPVPFTLLYGRNDKYRNWTAQWCRSHQPESEGRALYLRCPNDEAGFWAVKDDGPWVSKLRPSVASDVYTERDAGLDSINYCLYGRVFYLDRNDQLRREGVAAASCVWVRAIGIGGWNPHWNTPAHGQEWFVPFRLRSDQGWDPFTFFERPFEDVWREWQSARENPDSDVSFALHWAELSDDQREDLLYRWPRRDRLRLKLELELRLRDALLQDPSLWQSENADWLLNLKARDDAALYAFETYLQRQTEPISPELTRPIEILWARFNPFNEAVLAHEAARRWKTLNNRWFQGRAASATTHEQLEAHLRWREWQKQSGD